MPCTISGTNIYEAYIDIGTISREIYIHPSYIEYDNDNSTRIKSFSLSEQCEMIPREDDPTTIIWVCIAVLVILAIIGMVVINMCVEKKSKKVLAKKQKEDDEEYSEYSDYSDYSDEEEKKEEVKPEKKEENKTEVKTEEKTQEKTDATQQ